MEILFELIKPVLERNGVFSRFRNENQTTGEVTFTEWKDFHCCVGAIGGFCYQCGKEMSVK